MSETDVRPQLPEGWDWRLLGEIAKTSSGGTPKRSNAQYYEGTIPWLKISDLTDSIVYTTEERITNLGLKESSAQLLPAGTLVIAMYGSIGKLGILDMEAATNQAICAIRPDEDLVSRDFLYWFLFAQRPALRRAGYGGMQPNLSQRFLRALELPIPPRRDQDAIVRSIKELLSKLSAGLRSLEEGAETLPMLKRSIRARLFSEAEGRERLLLAQLCKQVGGHIQTGPFGSQLHASDYRESGTPVVMPKNLDFGVISVDGIARVGSEDAARLERHVLKAGDILQSRRGDLGRRAIVTEMEEGWLCGTGCFIIRLGDMGLAQFVLEHLGEPHTESFLKKEAVGVTMKNLNARTLQSIPLAIPDASARRSVLSEVRTHIAHADQLESSAALIRKKASQLRSAIFAQAFRGFAGTATVQL